MPFSHFYEVYAFSYLANKFPILIMEKGEKQLLTFLPCRVRIMPP